MAKYIIEIEDVPSVLEDGIAFFKCVNAPWWYISDTHINRLKPYKDAEHDTGEWREHIFDGIMGGRPRALMCTNCNIISIHASNFCLTVAQICGVRKMTKQEKIIVSAYTGVLMCDFADVHEYIQKKLGRPVLTHELADKGIQKEIEEKTKEEFLEICNREEPEPKQRRGHWIVWGGMDIPENHGKHKCSLCGGFAPIRYEKPLIKENLSNFCPNCGADMRGEGEG